MKPEPTRELHERLDGEVLAALLHVPAVLRGHVADALGELLLCEAETDAGLSDHPANGALHVLCVVMPVHPESEPG